MVEIAYLILNKRQRVALEIALKYFSTPKTIQKFNLEMFNFYDIKKRSKI